MSNWCRYASLLLAVAVPCAAAPIDDAKKQFDLLFGQDCKRVIATASTKDDAELAAQILNAAKSVRDKAELLAYLCAKAYELGIRNETGRATAEAAMQFLGETDPKRKAECDEKLIEVYRLRYAASRGSGKLLAGQRLLEQMVAVADHKLASGQGMQANRLYRRALSIAQMIRSPMRKAVLGKMRQASEAMKRQARAAVLKAKLEEDPKDVAARTDLIRYYLIDMNDPSKAAKLLTADVDETLRTYIPLATRPIDGVPPDACFELAEWHLALAKDAALAGKVTLLRRAKRYYQRYLAKGQPSGTRRLKAKVELERLKKTLGELAVKVPTGLPMPGAVLIMTFDDISFFKKGTRECVRDLSGRGNHGVRMGTTVVEGKAGKALRFNGVNDYVAFGNPADFQIRGSQSFVVWIRPGSTSYTRAVFCKAYGGEGAITIGYGGRLVYYYGDGRYSYPDQSFRMTRGLLPRRPLGRPKKPPPTPWTHVALVRDMRRRKLRWYCNGQLADEVEIRVKSIRATRENAYLGKGSSEYMSARTFQGELDELAIFARALTPIEIKAIHKLGLEGKSLR